MKLILTLACLTLCMTIRIQHQGTLSDGAVEQLKRIVSLLDLQDFEMIEMFEKNSHDLSEEEKEAASNCLSEENIVERAKCMDQVINKEKEKFDPAGNLQYSDEEVKHFSKFTEEEIKVISEFSVSDVKVLFGQSGDEIEKCHDGHSGQDRFECYLESLSGQEKHNKILVAFAGLYAAVAGIWALAHSTK